MAKSNKKSSQVSSFSAHKARDVDVHAVNCPVPLPDVVNMDDIAYMLDDELSSRLFKLEGERIKVEELRFETVLWETEIAYVKREMQMRRIRRENHERYVREQQRQFLEEEARLPPAEYDNLRFVQLVTGCN